MLWQAHVACRDGPLRAGMPHECNMASKGDWIVFVFEPYTPSPADTAWYPRELKAEARQAFRGIRAVEVNIPMVSRPVTRDERHVEPWTGCGMWSEWQVPRYCSQHWPEHAPKSMTRGGEKCSALNNAAPLAPGGPATANAGVAWRALPRARASCALAGRRFLK